MPQWYVAADRELGPYTESDLQLMFLNGHLNPSSQVRSENETKWVSFAEVKSLQSIVAASLRDSSAPRIETASLRRAAPPSSRSSRKVPFPNEMPSSAILESSSIHQSPPAPVIKAVGEGHVSAISATGRKDWPWTYTLTGLVMVAILLFLLFLIMFLLLKSHEEAGGGAGGLSALTGDVTGESGSESAHNSGAADSTGQDDIDSSVLGGPDSNPKTANSSALTTDEPMDIVTPDKPSIDDKKSEPSSANSKYSVGQSKFFGIPAEGRTFIYLVDCSGSMSGSRFDRAKRELLLSINSLSESQEFYVVFFSDEMYPMFSPHVAATKPLTASDENIDKATEWIEPFQTKSSQEPVAAVSFALTMSPDAIFLLTDGEINGSVPTKIRSMNTTNVNIHTICLESNGGERIMKQIASDNDGHYVFISK